MPSSRAGSKEHPKLPLELHRQYHSEEQEPLPTPFEQTPQKPSSSRKARSILSGHVKVHMPHVPWKRRSKQHQQSISSLAASPTPECSPGPSPAPSSFLGRSPLSADSAAHHVPTAKLGNLINDVVQWRSHGEGEVAVLQARIDDMWLDEVMLGCDTELFGSVRQAARAVESGQLDSESAIRQATAAAEEAEAMALNSVRARMQARDCVHLQGGLQALQQRVRRRRADTSDVVKPYVERLKEPGRAQEVVRVMDRLLREAQEEYESVNAMKTAKSEVVLELQDRASERDWLTRLLLMSLDLIEAGPLFSPTASPHDAEHFFVETVRSCEADDPLRERALRCLEHMRLWGNAAARALTALRPEHVEDTDSVFVTSPAMACAARLAAAAQPPPAESGSCGAASCCGGGWVSALAAAPGCEGSLGDDGEGPQSHDFAGFAAAMTVKAAEEARHEQCAEEAQCMPCSADDGEVPNNPEATVRTFMLQTSRGVRSERPSPTVAAAAAAVVPAAEPLSAQKFVRSFGSSDDGMEKEEEEENSDGSSNAGTGEESSPSTSARFPSNATAAAAAAGSDAGLVSEATACPGRDSGRDSGRRAEADAVTERRGVGSDSEQRQG
mmetsp:Transcript_64708/g.162837  ORF Transcript_64708/g.162837 Transcript_64708/m.162837 type:complete len:613 (+) Transcript_64708:98-1936(+)